MIWSGRRLRTCLCLLKVGKMITKRRMSTSTATLLGRRFQTCLRHEDELEETMISCSDKRKAVSEKRKLETLEAVNDSKLYRSLGGYKKYKSNRGDEEEEGGEEEKLSVKSEKEEVGKLEEAMLGLHRCEVCYKTFPTGQALVGHMRCHRVVPSSTSASAEEADSGYRVIYFDLNELPHEVEDGGAVDVAFHFMVLGSLRGYSIHVN